MAMFQNGRNQKSMKLNRLFYILFFVPLIFVACTADINLADLSGSRISTKTSAIIPLGTVNVNIGDIISKYYSSNPNLNTSDSSVIAYQYSDSIEYQAAKIDLLTNVQPFSKKFYLNPSGLPIPPIAPNTDLSPIVDLETFDFGINNTSRRVDSIFIQKAVFSVIINEEDLDVPASDVVVTVSFPRSNSFSVSPVAFGVENQVVMTNMKMVTTNGTLPMTITLRSKTGSNPVLLTSNSNVQFIFDIKQLDFDVAYGLFPPTSLSGNVQQFPLNLQRFIPSGKIFLSNPKIDFTILSNIGTYLDFKLCYLKSYVNNDTTTAVFARFNNNTSNSISLKVDKKPAQPGEWVSKTFQTFDKDNGHIDKLLENINQPNIFETKYLLAIDTAIAAKDKTPGFITPNPAIKVKYKITVPFSLNEQSYYDISDSVSSGFHELSAVLDQVKQPDLDSMVLVLNVKNGLPVNVTLQMQMVDTLGQEVVSDFKTEYLLKSGNVNSNGLVTPGNESKQIIQVLLTKQQLDILKTSSKIRYHLRIDGKDLNSKIHFSTNDHIDIQTAVFLKARLSTTFSFPTE
jgi:hypothetical protein